MTKIRNKQSQKPSLQIKIRAKNEWYVSTINERQSNTDLKGSEKMLYKIHKNLIPTLPLHERLTPSVRPFPRWCSLNFIYILPPRLHLISAPPISALRVWYRIYRHFRHTFYWRRSLWWGVQYWGCRLLYKITLLLHDRLVRTITMRAWGSCSIRVEEICSWYTAWSVVVSTLLEPTICTPACQKEYRDTNNTTRNNTSNSNTRKRYTGT